MPRPKGHKKDCACPFCAHVGKPKAKAKAKAKGKAPAAGARATSHKAYSYTNKKGKTVSVPAHTEHIKAKK